MSGAKAAHYKGDKLVMFAAMKTVTEDKYKLQKADETSLGLQTIGKWYTSEGLVSERQEGAKMSDGALNIAYVVMLVPDGDTWVVKVEPQMHRFVVGRPNPDILAPTDPSVPTWVGSRTEQLQFDIYQALKQYEVKSLPAMVPAGDTGSGAPGATTPVEPVPTTAPAAGSGSGS